MRGFAWDGGAVVAHLDDEERTVMARIVADVGLLLGGEPFGAGGEQPFPHADASHSETAGEDAPHSSIADEVAAYLARLGEAVREPDDPAVLRVLPNAAPTDREAADEFRRLTEPDLRSLKVGRLRRMWEQLSEDGPDWEVAADDAPGTAAALTDVRLVIAERLGLETDHDAERLSTEVALAAHAMETGADRELDIEPERVWLGMLYGALTWLQGSLVECLMGAGAGQDSTSQSNPDQDHRGSGKEGEGA